MDELDVNKEITVSDAGENNADINFLYDIFVGDTNERTLQKIAKIQFQKGTYIEEGPNGCEETDLIDIILDRYKDTIKHLEAKGYDPYVIEEYEDIHSNLEDIQDKMNELKKNKIDIKRLVD